MVSSIFSINLREFFKSFFVTVVGAILMAVKTIIEAGGSLPTTWTDWRAILLSGLGAGVVYIVATYFSGTDVSGALAQKNRAANR